MQPGEKRAEKVHTPSEVLYASLGWICWRRTMPGMDAEQLQRVGSSGRRLRECMWACVQLYYGIKLNLHAT